ncbi:MAG: multicopper oxidase domain-containing protein [Candidatus Dormibacteraeota bacterium]|uniref:Multicopper oxidase domain-containing protein n=1 Tax=Candidatus Amunia macphersoniae TaxID=3127014 RepID=A0A934KHH9_9BACT|nr:multicopper oxidase domain-containing protein [Candidatus Dormibacteraeota bacterium]
MTDQLRFKPGTISVKAGETVSFQVQNTGALEHEFVLEDQGMQDRHEHEMQGMNGTQSAGNNAIDVPPGQAKTLTFTFPSASGTYVYGCHVNGHYASGMRGTVTIT